MCFKKAESRTKISFKPQVAFKGGVSIVVDSWFIVALVVCWSYVFCYAVLSVLSSFAIILLGKRELVIVFMVYSGC